MPLAMNFISGLKPTRVINNYLSIITEIVHTTVFLCCKLPNLETCNIALTLYADRQRLYFYRKSNIPELCSVRLFAFLC